MVLLDIVNLTDISMNVMTAPGDGCIEVGYCVVLLLHNAVDDGIADNAAEGDDGGEFVERKGMLGVCDWRGCEG
jgi:hypothetical protein